MTNHLLDGVRDVCVDVTLCVNGVRVASGVGEVHEEQMSERHQILLLKLDHHLITETKPHQLHTQAERKKHLYLILNANFYFALACP